LTTAWAAIGGGRNGDGGRGEQGDGRGGLIMATNTAGKRRGSTGRGGAEKSTLIEQVAEEVERQLKAEARSWGTISRARQVFRMLKEGCGVRAPADLNGSVSVVERFQTLRPDLLPVSRAAYLRDFKSLCHRMVKMGHLSSIPVFPPIPQARSFPRATKRAPTPSPEEVKRYLEHLAAKAEGDCLVHKTLALVASLAFGGLSRSEAFRLRVSDIDLEPGVISIRTRREEKYTIFPPRVPIQSELRAILVAWLPKCGCDWVFPGARRRGPWRLLGGSRNGNDPVRVMKREAILAGIKTPITFEGLRRFYVENAALTVPGISPGSAPHLEIETVSLRAPIPISETTSQTKHATESSDAASIEIVSETHVSFSGGQQVEVRPAQLDVIRILLDAYPNSISLEELKARSKKFGAPRTTLGILVKNPEFARRIRMPGSGYPGKAPVLGILSCREVCESM
jgi:integrase